MRTIEHTLLKFEELTDEQKKTVLDKNRDWNVEGFDWFEYTIDDAKTIGNLLGIDIDDVFFSGFWSQGDGACFTGSFCHTKNIVKNITEHVGGTDKELIQIAKEIQELFRKSFYMANGTIKHTGHYNHERSMSIYLSDYDIKGSADDREWADVFADFAKWIYKRLEEEYEYLTSDEVVAESIIANEQEFELDEDGDLI